MKAVGFKKSLPIEEENSFIEFETEQPRPEPKDILVRIQAVSVNPVDYKIRQSAAKEALDTPKIIGWDAAGIVEDVGAEVTMFQKGDEVWYSGDLTRPGCNAEYQVVDERLVSLKPKNLNWQEAAAMPLTTLTAWECIFDRMHISRDSGEDKNILIIGGAGGVGSIAIQLLKKLTKLEVIATASRKETADWCKEIGADKVVNHYELDKELPEENSIDYILNFADTSGHWENMARLIAPEGAISCVVNTTEKVDLNLLKNKSVSFHWELMFTRPKFQTSSRIRQHEILDETRKLFESGQLKTTLEKHFEGLKAETFKEVHKLQESGESIGKNVIVF
ncbi:MAG: zinc-binding alcohol dehydrogenase family protein [Christiangramia sp.]|nr:NADPH:quinone reductase [Christiangramia sp.]